MTFRKHNNAVAQVMEESARVNPVTPNDAVERQLTTTTRHVVCFLAFLIIPTAFILALTQVLRLKVIVFVTSFYFSITNLCSGLNPVLYYRGNAQINDGITKLVKCQWLQDA